MNYSDSFPNLRAIGFCGADDSTHPELLCLLSQKYDWIEWGILFRPDLEGTPRYPSSEWIQRLDHVNKSNNSAMRLAAHLCKQRCQEVLDGDVAFAKQLVSMGFRRAQVNATSANGVDVGPGNIQQCIRGLRSTIEAVPEIEWIIQLNDETNALWLGLSENPPKNMSVLNDASCGKGVLVSTFPAPPADESISCGYAGGIGPDTLSGVLSLVQVAAVGRPVWVDMESSLRILITDKSVKDKDVFSIDKCFQCVLIASQLYGLKSL